MYSHVSTTLTGLSTVRAFDAQNVFERQFYRYLNDNTSTFFMFVCASRGFGILMDWICITYIASVVTFIMLYPDGISYIHLILILSSILNLFIIVFTVRNAGRKRWFSFIFSIDAHGYDSMVCLKSNFLFINCRI